MKKLFEKVYGNVVLIQRQDYAWCVTDLEGNVIVPFGKYRWIDGFEHGLARVRIGPMSNLAVSDNKWGIINERGEEVLPCEYDSVWNFLHKNRYSTKVVKDGKAREVYFHDLNPDLPVRGVGKSYRSYRETCSEHYEEFAGTYAQDVAGYSDEDIYDAFEGDPDAYWNID